MSSRLQTLIPKPTPPPHTGKQCQCHELLTQRSCIKCPPFLNAQPPLTSCTSSPSKSQSVHNRHRLPPPSKPPPVLFLTNSPSPTVTIDRQPASSMTGHITRRPFTFSTYINQILPSLVLSSASHRPSTTSNPVNSSTMAPKVITLPKDETTQAVKDCEHGALTGRIRR